jgi:hypothetical protein
MATIAGIELRLEDAAFSAGAAFRLSDSDFDPTTIELADGELVAVHPREGVILAFRRHVRAF